MMIVVLLGVACTFPNRMHVVGVQVYCRTLWWPSVRIHYIELGLHWRMNGGGDGNGGWFVVSVVHGMLLPQETACRGYIGVSSHEVK